MASGLAYIQETPRVGVVLTCGRNWSGARSVNAAYLSISVLYLVAEDKDGWGKR